jgi:hypothetical protein
MTAEIFLAIGLFGVVAVSLIGLVLCYRLRVAERRNRVALKFDPMAFHGVETGDINRRRRR